MIIPLEFYNHLRQQLRVSEIVRQKVLLQRKGNEYLGLCPFHMEKTPSFTVNDAKGFYHCFGCNAHGDLIKFVSEMSGLGPKEAAIKIAMDNGIEIPKVSKAQEKEYEEAEEIYRTLELAAEYFHDNLNPETERYLDKRGINKQSQKKFCIGYAKGKGDLLKYFEKKSIPLKNLLNSGLVGKKENGRIYEIFNNRLMFPIRNIYNKIVGFGGRILTDGSPKYINSPETLVFRKNETMYGENIAISSAYKKNYAIIVEGYMDVIALNQAGIQEVVASLGTAVTEKHLQKLWRSADEVIACLDGDDAGQRASSKLISTALPMIGSEKKITFINLYGRKDPDEVIRSEGIAVFNKLFAERMDLSKTIWQNEYKGKVFSSAESKAELERNLENYCSQIKDRILATSFRKYFKDQIWQNLYRSRSNNNARNRDAHGVKAKSRTLIAAGKDNITHLQAGNNKKYTEMEVLERSLCSFVIQFPEILQNSSIRSSLTDLHFS